MNVSIVIVDTYPNKQFARLAINSTLSCVDCKKVLSFSNHPIITGETFIRINPIGNLKEYSEFVLQSIPHFIDSEHVVIIQWDGFAVNRKLWDNAFLSCDFIGAPWSDKPPDKNVGNGGFSLRSSRLMQAVRQIPIHTSDEIFEGDAEDVLICQHYRNTLEGLNMTFADFETARRFSYENGPNPGRSFGFHGSFNFPFYFRESSLIEFHEEFLARVRNPRILAVFLYNALRVHYLEIIRVCHKSLAASQPEIIHTLRQIFTKHNLTIPYFTE